MVGTCTIINSIINGGKESGVSVGKSKLIIDNSSTITTDSSDYAVSLTNETNAELKNSTFGSKNAIGGAVYIDYDSEMNCYKSNFFGYEKVIECPWTYQQVNCDKTATFESCKIEATKQLQPDNTENSFGIDLEYHFVKCTGTLSDMQITAGLPLSCYGCTLVGTSLTATAPYYEYFNGSVYVGRSCEDIYSSHQSGLEPKPIYLTDCVATSYDNVISSWGDIHIISGSYTGNEDRYSLISGREVWLRKRI